MVCIILWGKKNINTDVAVSKSKVKPVVRLGLKNVRSVGNKLDYVFDHNIR